MIFIIAFFAFIAAASLVVIAFMLPMAAQDTPQARIKKRLTTIGGMAHASRAEIQNLLKSTKLSEVPWLNDLLSRVKFIRRLDLLLERANVDMTPGMFLFACVDVFGVTTFLFSLSGQSLLVSLAIGIIAGFCPYFYIKYLTWKRLRKFLEQMPDGLDMISQSLQAGQGLTQALVYVGKEMPDPIGTEFSVFVEEVNLGLPVNDALRKFEERMSLPEVRLFNTALTVQREVGGSLAELLTKLSDIIRDRFRIERLIKSLTAQNRMSAWVVCMIPPGLGFFMFIKEPEIMTDMLSNPSGQAMLAVAVGLELAGILSFRYLIKVHI